jgi:hypothetical protein
MLMQRDTTDADDLGTLVSEESTKSQRSDIDRGRRIARIAKKEIATVMASYVHHQDDDKNHVPIKPSDFALEDFPKGNITLPYAVKTLYGVNFINAATQRVDYAKLARHVDGDPARTAEVLAFRQRYDIDRHRTVDPTHGTSSRKHHEGKGGISQRYEPTIEPEPVTCQIGCSTPELMQRFVRSSCIDDRVTVQFTSAMFTVQIKTDISVYLRELKSQGYSVTLPK